MNRDRSASRPLPPDRWCCGTGDHEPRSLRFASASAEEFGGLDILVNNGGVMLLGPVAGADSEQWRRMLDVNLAGLLYCTHAAPPILGAAGSGDIVNVSSVAGRIAAMGSGVYNMTKWGVTGFSEALRQECSHANARVTAIEPGWVDTELQGHNEHPQVVEAITRGSSPPTRSSSPRTSPAP